MCAGNAIETSSTSLNIRWIKRNESRARHFDTTGGKLPKGVLPSWFCPSVDDPSQRNQSTLIHISLYFAVY